MLCKQRRPLTTRPTTTTTPIRAHSQLPQQQVSGPLWLAEATGRPVVLTTDVGAPGPEQNLWLLSCWASLLRLSWLCCALGPTDHLSLYCFSVILVTFWETPRSDTPALTAMSNRSLGSQDLTGPWCLHTEPGCESSDRSDCRAFPKVGGWEGPSEGLGEARGGRPEPARSSWSCLWEGVGRASGSWAGVRPTPIEASALGLQAPSWLQVSEGGCHCLRIPCPH